MGYHILPGLPVFVVSKVITSTTHMELKGNPPHHPSLCAPPSKLTFVLTQFRSALSPLSLLLFPLNFLLLFPITSLVTGHRFLESLPQGEKKKNPLNLAWERHCCFVLNSLKNLNIPDHLEAFLNT